MMYDGGSRITTSYSRSAPTPSSAVTFQLQANTTLNSIPSQLNTTLQGSSVSDDTEIHDTRAQYRVIPQFCAEIRKSDIPEQRETLALLLANWSHFLHAELTAEDAEELLFVLFHLLSRTEAEDGFQTAQARLVSDMAFQILHDLFTQPSAHTEDFLVGLRQLLGKLHCTDDHLYARPKPPKAKITWTQMRRELGLAEKEGRNFIEAIQTKKRGKISAELAHIIANTELFETLLELNKEETQKRKTVLDDEAKDWDNQTFKQKKQRHWELIGLFVGDAPSRNGVLVLNVTPDSPAWVAGIRENDEIINCNNGPTPNYRALKEKFRTATRPGQRVTVNYLRDDWKPGQVTIGATLGPEGSALLNVIEGGPAEAAGLKVGDVVTHVAGKDMTNRGVFRDEIAVLEEGETVEIRTVENPEGVQVTVASFKGEDEGPDAIADETIIFMPPPPVLDYKITHMPLQLSKEDSVELEEGQAHETDEEEEEQEVILDGEGRPITNKFAHSQYVMRHSERPRTVEQQEDDDDDDDNVLVDDGLLLTSSAFYMDRFLERDEWRACAVRLIRTLDFMGINTYFFMKAKVPHLYFTHQFSKRAQVFRDFIECPARPRLGRPWGPPCFVHIKTNIPSKSEIMYRFLIEGYNYGTNGIINCDCIGYTHKRWDQLGDMELYGWPEGWDKHSINHYAHGAKLTQYFSSDGFVTLRLEATSFFCVGFTVSCWLVCHGYGANFKISATLHHNDENI